MLTVPFLTDLDSRAAVKGSRDPLGIQPIWTRLGRHVVGNLTTVSNSVRDFTVTLLGYFFAERVAADLGPGTELATFLKWEQLASYARAAGNEDWAFRGTERVRKVLSEGSRIVLSADRAYQILGNQRIYGLWGLYTVPSRASGMLAGDPPRLTPPARELVERTYLPILRDEGFSDGKRIVEVLRQPMERLDIRGSDARLVGAVARILERRLLAPEKEFYRYHLLHCGPQDATGGRQQQLATLLDVTLADHDFGWSPLVLGALAKEARRMGEPWHELAQRLERIRICETVTAPMGALFTHILALDGKPVDALVARLRSEWGPEMRTIDPDQFSALEAEIGSIAPEVGQRWVAIANAGARGDYPLLLSLLCEQNHWVMSSRGGAQWVAAEEGQFQVRFRDEAGDLPKRADLPTLWRSPYFLESLRMVARALKES